MDGDSHTRDKTWLWLILLVGALVRLYRLDFHSLWADEGLQYYIASAESFHDVFGRLSHTFHPLLSFMINHVFLQISNTDFFLRLPSALFGIGSIPLIYMLARRIVSKPVAIFAMLVFAISPFHVWYSQDGRMYTQLLFLSLLSTQCLLQALEHKKLHWWGWYMLAVGAGMYTHILMGLGVMAQALWVLLYHRRHLLAYCISGIVVIVLCWPLVLQRGGSFLRRVERTFTAVERTHTGTQAPYGKREGFVWAALPYTFFVYGAGLSLGPSVAELHEEKSVEFLVQFLPDIVLVGVIFGALLVTGLVTFPRHAGAKSLVLCLLGLGVPVAGVSALSLMTRFVFNVRYSIVAFPYFCILVGVALAFLWRKNRWAGTVAVCAVLVVSIASLANHFFNPYYAKEDVRSAVALWRTISPHEPLLVCSSSAFLVTDTVRRYLDATEEKRIFRIGNNNIVENINSILATHNTTSAYIILVRDWHNKRERTIRNFFTVDNIRSYPGVQILRIFRQ
jgi:uncharacterized membrane protein